MLETIGEYALERLMEGGELEQLRRRHAEYYLELARSVEDLIRSPQAAALLDRLERDHDNLRAALAWLSGTTPDRALRLAVWGLAARLHSFGDVARPVFGSPHAQVSLRGYGGPPNFGPAQSELFGGYGRARLRLTDRAARHLPRKEVVDLHVRVPVVAIPYPVPR